MGKAINILQELIPFLEEYESSNSDRASLTSFLDWMNNIKRPTPSDFDLQPYHSIDSQIGEHLTRLNKFVKIYGKMALKDSPLAGLDDFILLVSLSEGKDKTKKETISDNLLDYNTGIGIIRRLLSMGLIQEFDDKQDKRAKRIELSTEGRSVLNEINSKMTLMVEIVTADLNQASKESLVSVLQYLDRFHNTNIQTNLDKIQNHSPLKT